jgi:hypothetical protein
MTLTNYIRPAQERPELAKITGGMSAPEILLEIERGGRFVVYQYVISAIFLTFRRNSPVRFVKAGESAVMKGMPFTVLTFLLGWWGFPWGLIRTPQTLYKNLTGGEDITPYIRPLVTPKPIRTMQDLAD